MASNSFFFPSLQLVIKIRLHPIHLVKAHVYSLVIQGPLKSSDHQHVSFYFSNFFFFSFLPIHHNLNKNDPFRFKDKVTHMSHTIGWQLPITFCALSFLWRFFLGHQRVGGTFRVQE